MTTDATKSLPPPPPLDVPPAPVPAPVEGRASARKRRASSRYDKDDFATDEEELRIGTAPEYLHPKDGSKKKQKTDAAAAAALPAPAAPAAHAAPAAPPANMAPAAGAPSAPIVVDSDDDDAGGGADHADAKIPVHEMKVGDIFSHTGYLRVARAFNGTNIQVEVLRGMDSGRIWVFETADDLAMQSASRYAETIKLTKTQMAEKLANVGQHVFTATFRTILDDKRLREQLLKRNGELRDVKTPTDVNNLVKSMAGARECTLIGRLMSSEGKLGYSLIDTLNGGASRKPVFRNINHRDIKELIVNNTRYQAK